MYTLLDRLVGGLHAGAVPATRLLVPVSGGSGHAPCFWICTRAWPDKTLGVFFGERLRGRAWLEAHGLVETLPTPEGDHREQEVRRWTTLLEMSATRGGWLVGSRNRTEDALGTYSMASR